MIIHVIVLMVHQLKTFMIIVSDLLLLIVYNICEEYAYSSLACSNCPILTEL